MSLHIGENSFFYTMARAKIVREALALLLEL